MLAGSVAAAQAMVSSLDPVGALLTDVPWVWPAGDQDGQDIGILHVCALQLPHLVAVLGEVQELVSTGVLRVAAVEDVADLRGTWVERHLEDRAEGIEADGLARRGPAGIGRAQPGVQAPEVIVVRAGVIAVVAGRAAVVQRGKVLRRAALGVDRRRLDMIHIEASSCGMKLWSGPGSFSSPRWMMKLSALLGSVSGTFQIGAEVIDAVVAVSGLPSPYPLPRRWRRPTGAAPSRCNRHPGGGNGWWRSPVPRPGRCRSWRRPP